MGWHSFDDMPAVPDGASPTYRNDAAWTGWSIGGAGNSLSVANGIMTVVYGGSAGGYAAKAIASPSGSKMRIRYRLKSGMPDTVSEDIYNGAADYADGLAQLDGAWKIYCITTAQIGASIGIYLGSWAGAGAHTIEISDAYIGNGSYAAGWPRDNSGSGSNGTACVGVVPCAGVSGNGLAFNGSTSTITLGPSMVPIGAFTLTYWMQTTTDNRRIYEKYGVAGNRSLITGVGRVGANKAGIQLSADGTTVVNFDSLTSVTTGAWVFVAFVYTPSTSLGIYINGALDAHHTTNIPSSIAISTVPLTLVPAGANCFLGSLDDPRIYSRALAPEEIAYLYTNPGGPQAGTVYADMLYANAILVKLAEISNLSVDQLANIIRINAGSIYDGNAARVENAQDAGSTLYQIPSPDAQAGKFARGYFDLAAGKLRAGNETKYLHVDGPGGILTAAGLDVEVNSLRGGGRYAADGSIADGTKPGFYIGASGACKAAGLQFEGSQGGGVQWSGGVVVGDALSISGLTAPNICALSDTVVALTDASDILRLYSWNGKTWTETITKSISFGDTAVSRMTSGLFAVFDSAGTLTAYDSSGTKVGTQLTGLTMYGVFGACSVNATDVLLIMSGSAYPGTSKLITQYHFASPNWTEVASYSTTSHVSAPRAVQLSPSTFAVLRNSTSLLHFTLSGTTFTLDFTTTIDSAGSYYSISAINGTDIVVVSADQPFIKLYRVEGSEFVLKTAAASHGITGGYKISVAGLNGTDIALVDNSGDTLRTLRFGFALSAPYRL
jgi:hypothetical protein